MRVHYPKRRDGVLNNLIMRTNIKSWLPVFPGFYATHFEPDYESSIDDGKTVDDYNWEYADYELDVCRSVVKTIDQKLNELGFALDIKFECQSSPRFYNFSNDSIHCTFKLKRGCIAAIKNYLIANTEAYQEYLSRYRSCSGFISYHSSYSSDWLGYINKASLKDNAHYIGSMFDFILNNEGFDAYWLYEYTEVYIFGELIPVEELETEPVEADPDFWFNLNQLSFTF